VIGGMSRRKKAGYPPDRLFRQQQCLCRPGLKTPKDLAGKTRRGPRKLVPASIIRWACSPTNMAFKLADVKVLPLQSLSNAARPR